MDNVGLDNVGLDNVGNFSLNNIHLNYFDDFWIFLISSFIAHGFLDIITFYPTIQRNLYIYLFSIGFFSILNIFLPFITTLFFVIISMYHFGEDFRFVFQNKFDNKKSNKLTSSDLRWGGVTLFSSSVLSDYTIWDNILKILNISNPNLFIYFVLFLSLPTVFKFDTNLLYIPTVIGGLIGSVGGVKGLLLYSSCVHSPLSIYRYIAAYDQFFYKCQYIVIWSSGTLFIYYTSPIIYLFSGFEQYILNIIIGIVITHVLFVTRWQISKDCELIIKKHHSSIKKSLLL